LTVQREVIRTQLRITLATHFDCAKAFHRSVSSHAEARPTSVDHPASQGAEASRHFNISSQLIREVMRVESADDTRLPEDGAP
jgi:soluble lytic murein transglycosylase-like protein